MSSAVKRYLADVRSNDPARISKGFEKLSERKDAIPPELRGPLLERVVVVLGDQRPRMYGLGVTEAWNFAEFADADSGPRVLAAIRAGAAAAEPGQRGFTVKAAGYYLKFAGADERARITHELLDLSRSTDLMFTFCALDGLEAAGPWVPDQQRRAVCERALEMVRADRSRWGEGARRAIVAVCKAGFTPDEEALLGIVLAALEVSFFNEISRYLTLLVQSKPRMSAQARRQVAEGLERLSARDGAEEHFHKTASAGIHFTGAAAFFAESLDQDGLVRLARQTITYVEIGWRFTAEPVARVILRPWRDEFPHALRPSLFQAVAQRLAVPQANDKGELAQWAGEAVGKAAVGERAAVRAALEALRNHYDPKVAEGAKAGLAALDRTQREEGNGSGPI